jgi:hypothetical protein
LSDGAMAPGQLMLCATRCARRVRTAGVFGDGRGITRDARALVEASSARK